MKNKPGKLKSIRKKSSFWILLVAAVVLEATACIQYFTSRKAIQREAEERARTELRAADLKIRAATIEKEAAAQMLSTIAELYLDNPQAMFKCTRFLLETLDDIESAGIAFVDGYYPQYGRWFEVCSSRPDPLNKDSIYTRQIGGAHHDYLQTEWFQNGLSIDSAWWCEPYLDDAGANTHVVSCTYPIRDKTGRVVAVTCIDMSLDYLAEVCEYLQIFPGSYYSIQSSKGEDIVDAPDTIPGRKYLTFEEEIGATGWHISIIIPEDILFAGLKHVGLIITILMLIGMALLGFILYISARDVRRIIALNTMQEKMENELEIAQTIQNAMLPKIFPPFLDRLDVNMYGFVRPAKEIGGDLYDFYVRHDKLFFCVGDVSGKGIPAALVMATTRSLFRSISAHDERAAYIVTKMNEAMADQNDQNMFVTLFVGVMDMSTGKVEYCNAGHNAPIHVKATSEPLPALPNLPLGIVSAFEYKAQTMTLKHGESLFLFTDGLTEAENETHEQFGDERMMAVLKKQMAARPREVVEAMQAEVDAFVHDAPQSDDLTMLAIRYQIPAIVMRNDIQQIPTLAEWVEGLGVPQELNMPVNLALEEIVSNVMLYAYPKDQSGKVFVEFVRTKTDQGEQLVFTVSDSGKPFDPTQKEDADISLSAEEREIGGLGIHLVRQLMDEIRYVREEDKNILTLIKKL